MMLSAEDSVANDVVLARFFEGGSTMTEVLSQLAGSACDALSDNMAGITMLVEGKPATGAFTDVATVKIDAKQYDCGSGPGLVAFSKLELQRIAKTVREDRWLELAGAARSHGIHSTLSLSLPLSRTSEPLGALSLYARRSNFFDDLGTPQTELVAAPGGDRVGQRPSVPERLDARLTLGADRDLPADSRQGGGVRLERRRMRPQRSVSCAGPGFTAPELQTARCRRRSRQADKNRSAAPPRRASLTIGNEGVVKWVVPCVVACR